MSDPTPTITKSDEERVLETGEREFMVDVRTQDMELNMGPQHPATHGVLRLTIDLDGETMHNVDPVVGYLHRGKEKSCESLGWRRFFPHTDRMDYVQPFMNNIAYALSLEKLAGVEVHLVPGEQLRA